MNEMLDKSRALREQRDAAANSMEGTHREIIEEFDRATKMNHGSYGLRMIDGFWQRANTPTPTIAESVSNALCLLGQMACIYPPQHGENAEQYTQRINEMLTDRWRREKSK